MNTSSTTTTPTASAESPILEYVTIADAADEIDAGIYQIHQFAHSGKVRAVRFGKKVLVSLDDVEAYGAELRGLTLASVEALSTIELALRIINETHSTTHTPASVAEGLGIDLETATRADVTRIAHHVGVALMR